MSLIRLNDRRLFPNVNSLFDGFFNDDINVLSPISNAMSLPAVNVIENDESYVMELAAPGKAKKDFDIKIDKGLINISSEESEEHESENKNYTRKEYSYQSFNRSFNLPDEVKEDEINASYKDGILTIVMPKKDVVVSTSKSIEIT